jgi:hypothetical protein
MTPARLVWLATTAFAAAFGTLAVLRHRAFGTGRFDLGNMTQAVWATANGHALSVTDVQGEQISRLGSHFDPILAALAPLWWLWPSPELLLVVQAVAVALGALPVFWLARAHLESERAAAALAATYLLYPPVQWLTVSDFHPVALACPLLLLAWWFLDQRRLLPFALCAALAVTAKEHVGLTVAAMGLWYALRYRAPRVGLAVAATAGLIALVAALIVVPHYAAAGSSAFESRYDDPGLNGRDVSYLGALLLPLGLLPLAAPLALVAAVPELALNMLSSHPDLGKDALCGDRHPRPPRRHDLCRRAVRRPARVSRSSGSAGRRGDSRSSRPDRHHSRTARRCGTASARGDPRRRCRERDQRARGAPVGAPAHLQLPDPPGRHLGGGRHHPPDLSRQPQTGAFGGAAGGPRA